MALNVKAFEVTQPGATGAQTYELGDNFDPKCGLVLATPVAADGIVPHASICLGYFTYRGGVVQQNFTSTFAEDNVGTSDSYNRENTDAVAILLDGTGAVDLDVDFTSLTSGVGADVTLTWNNLHTTAGVRLMLLVFGGSDVLDAQAHTFTTAAGTGAQSVALGAGFGHPDVVFWVGTGWADGAVSNAGGNFYTGFGVRGGGARSIAWASQDAATTENTGQRIQSNAFIDLDGATSTFPVENTWTLATEAGWPTDGYAINKTTAVAGESYHGLAIRFSTDVTITSGGQGAPTSTSNQDLAVGTSTPKGLVLFHTRQTTANATDASSTDAALAGVGFVDGDGNERWAGCWDDDAQATASVASSGQSITKAIRLYVPSADALDAESDAVVSGSNFRLTWADPPPSAFLYNWVAFGITAAAESHSGAAGSTGGGSSVVSGRKGALRTVVTTGGGTPASVGVKGALRAVSTTGGGTSATAIRKGGKAAAATTGGGQATAAIRKGALRAPSSTGGGSSSATGTQREAHQGAATATGGGTSTAQGRKGAARTAQTTGGGAGTTTGLKRAARTVATSGGGQASSSARKAASSAATVTGGGSSTAVGSAGSATNRNGTAATTGGGSSTAQGRKGAATTASTHGGGSCTAQGRKGALHAATATGGGQSTAAGTTGSGRTGSCTTSGGGSSSATGRKGARAIAAATGGGQGTASWRRAARSSCTTIGGGTALPTWRRGARGACSTSGGGLSSTIGGPGRPLPGPGHIITTVPGQTSRGVPGHVAASSGAGGVSRGTPGHLEPTTPGGIT